MTPKFIEEPKKRHQQKIWDEFDDWDGEVSYDDDVNKVDDWDDDEEEGEDYYTDY